MEEEFRDIEGYEGLYQVSNLGRVKSFNYHRTKKEKILQNVKKKDGYNIISLFKNKKRKILLVHRLVAQVFIFNTENKPCINHINGIKTDNRVNNLEWCTAKENTQHAWKTGLSNHQSLYKSIRIKNLKTDETLDFKSITEAKKYLNNNCNLYKVLTGRNKICKGWTAEYL